MTIAHQLRNVEQQLPAYKLKEAVLDIRCSQVGLFMDVQVLHVKAVWTREELGSLLQIDGQKHSRDRVLEKVLDLEAVHVGDEVNHLEVVVVEGLAFLDLRLESSELGKTRSEEDAEAKVCNAHGVEDVEAGALELVVDSPGLRSAIL